ncbi:hypothetical protein TNCT_405851 [Trichonephila clavata]|uniref:Uncharacterized protein n=1 Tax=Trichonephila clavata TaxID=2740835 RepID=A0A8X6HDJ6_TRICU|nr:hypothetical protein TNCT_405851 [Trichonephila clavata]
MFHMGHLNSIIGAIFKTHRTLWEFPASDSFIFTIFLHFLYSIRLRVIRAGYEMVFNLTQKNSSCQSSTQTSVSSFGMQVAIITSFLQLKRNVALPTWITFFIITETGAANEIHESMKLRLQLYHSETAEERWPSGFFLGSMMTLTVKSYKRCGRHR